MDSAGADLAVDGAGFDLEAGKEWIYPTNYPIRDYQFNIVQKCLWRNTLVCLPTGLGKTFIAAVVMFNFYRWYPRGKIVFLAPTKPLVGQQIEACHSVMGIAQEHLAEMTGMYMYLSFYFYLLFFSLFYFSHITFNSFPPFLQAACCHGNAFPSGAGRGCFSSHLK